MRTDLIFHKDGNLRLILIFAGWSTTSSFYRGLHADGWDIAIVWDYSDLSFDPEIAEKYSTVILIAWSLGVAAAAHAAATTLSAEKIATAIAVNGTLFPSSDKFGIPEKIYETTRATLNARNLLKFTKRMGYIPPIKDSATTSEDVYIPDFERLSLELENMRSGIIPGKLPWKKVFISDNDKIFPPSSMQKAWDSWSPDPQIIHLDAPHYVNLQLIIDEVTPDIRKIADRFGNAFPTYNENAYAQIKISERLFQGLDLPGHSVDLLEIGTGTGLLARKFLNDVDLKSATFIDLYPIQKFNIIPDEIYIEDDAEKWILNAESKSFDIIASSSTIQWFADQRNFFRHAARLLRPGGQLLCSSFLPGNLSELDTRRPARLIYRTEEELLEYLSGYFEDITIESEAIRLKFESRMALIRHLKLTGVAGGKASSLPFPDNRQKIPEMDSGEFCLTYRPVYIKGVKR